MSPLANLPGMFEFYGACGDGVFWLSFELKENPHSTIRELWAKMLKLPHRVGIAWGAWVAKQIDMPCQNGTYSGAVGVNSGPIVEKLDVEEVERRIIDHLNTYHYYLRRRDVLREAMRT